MTNRSQVLAKSGAATPWRKYIRLFLTGFAMGSADIVPGVSGGTVAFIAGIYEDLVASIKTLSGRVLALGLKGDIRGAIAAIPFGFLIPLALGLGIAVFSLANALSYLLVNYPVHLWSFFFGLILASVVIVRRRVQVWSIGRFVSLVAAAIAAYLIVGAVPVETPNTYPAIFLSGSIAICAMILPGISGSFLLVIMGKYQQILAAVTQRDFLTLGVFLLGAAIGIALFSRVVSWLFARHHDVVVAGLIGLMLGSLRKVWPWKETILTRIDSHGVAVPVVERNILPTAVDGSLFLAIGLFVLGLVLVVYLERLAGVEVGGDDHLAVETPH
jgi:putative membrane protein